MSEKNIEWEILNLFDSDEDEDEDEDDAVDSYSEGSGRLEKMMNLKKLVQTPIGPFILDDAYHPLRGLPVAIAHVNFPITDRILASLDSVVGIEAFKHVGRYRLLFIFGKLFDMDEVMASLERVLGVSESTSMDIDLEQFSVAIQDIVKDMGTKLTSEHWIAYIFPNGKYMCENLLSEDEVKHRYDE